MTSEAKSQDPAGVKRRNPKDAMYGRVTPIWDEDMGERLATIRMLMKKDQAMLGGLLGITQQQLSNVERARVTIEEAITLAKLSAVLGTHFSYVMLGSNADRYDPIKIRHAYNKSVYARRGFGVAPRYRPIPTLGKGRE